MLGKVELGPVPAELNEYRDQLYTCLYRSYLLPHNVTSSAGQYRVAGDEQTVRDIADTADDYVHYAGWTSWDDFRKYSLISLTEPTVAQNIARSIVEWFKGGDTPQWGSGYWPAPTVRHEFIGAIVADAYLKGLNGFDAEAAYQGVQKKIIEKDKLEKPYQYYLAMLWPSLWAKRMSVRLREQALGYRKYWCPSQTDGEGNLRASFTKTASPLAARGHPHDAFLYQGNCGTTGMVPHDMNAAQLRGVTPRWPRPGVLFATASTCR